MNRDIASSTSTPTFDLLVIGGGITGAGIAWEAATRGLTVCLLEQSDFGSGASTGCFRIVHGGIRYLQHLDLCRVYESAREQYNLRRSAPHLVHPFPFLIPCYGRGKKSKAYIGFGAHLYDLLTFFRNKGLDTEHELPAPEIWSRQRVLSVAPGIPAQNLSGGVVFYDCQIHHCERLTFAIVETARQAGAVTHNYAKVCSWNLQQKSTDESVVESVDCIDQLTGQQFSVRARQVVNAAGPWIPELNKALPAEILAAIPPVSSKSLHSKGIQVVLPEIVSRYALAIESSQTDFSAIINRGTRSYFLVPWRGNTLLGTSESVYQGSADGFEITSQEISDLVADAARVYSHPLLNEQQVRWAFGGLRQLDEEYFTKGSSIGEAPPSKVDQMVDYGSIKGCQKRVSNLLSVGCVKYTTFRSVAERAIDLLEKKSSLKIAPSRSANILIHGGVSNWQDFYKDTLKELSSFVTDTRAGRNIICDYGLATLDIIKSFRDNPELTKLIPGTNITRGEVVYSRQREMVCKEEDLLFRRTVLGHFGPLSPEALAEVRQIMSM